MPPFHSRREAEKKLSRILKQLAKLYDGIDVQLRDIKSVLRLDQYKSFEEDWKSQKTLRYEQKPNALKRYEDALGKALLLHGKYDAATGKSTIVDTLKNKTDGAFEAAFEVLQETIAADQGLRVWFDREIDFEFGTDIDLDPDRMPRVLTSRSRENRSDINSQFGIKRRKQCKIDALEKAKIELDQMLLADGQRAELEQKVQADSTKLQGMLKNLRKGTD